MLSNRKSFGRKLRQIRIAKGFSLRKFAELVGISPTYLSIVEQGKVEKAPTAERVQKMAELLGENPDEWIAQAGRMPDDLPEIIRKHPEALPALLRSTKGLSAEQVQKLIANAEKMKKKEGRK